MHDVRIVYLVRDEKPIKESQFLPGAVGGCPITGARASTEKVMYPPVWFGRMFPPRRMEGLSEEQLMKIAGCLIKLGKCMDNPAAYFNVPENKPDAPAGVVANPPQQESDIPAGYTYLGQFIAHEVTFDGVGAKSLPLVEEPENIRSPSLDLDSLYGAGADDEPPKELYEQGPYPVRLKVGWTQPPPPTAPTDSSKRSTFPEFQNDLPRKVTRAGDGDEKERGVALIGDERNDENLPLAQTHVAFLKFHNRVVEDLKGGRYKDCPPPASEEELFKRAREEVVKHFQWIVLKDYLPRIVNKDLLKSLTREPSSDKFTFKDKNDLFIPLEFSAAAFRIGHSMVRREYLWNQEQGKVKVFQLFTQTKRSGNLGGFDRLNSTWVIDWKRFYDFTPFASEYPPPYDPPQVFNRAAKIDTVFDLHLEKITGFQNLPQPGAANGAGEKPDEKKAADTLFNGEKALPARNLLRGLALGLPWAEDVADELQKKELLTEEERLTPAELRDGPHAKLLDAEAFDKKTPLWFYVLREAAAQEAKVPENHGRLGPVGGRIVAETLIGLIRHSTYSILQRVEGEESEWELSDWRPAYGRVRDVPEGVKFEMVDLLRAADVVDPMGKFNYQTVHPRP
ncbi:MAG: hypothetical protein JOZ02_13095 [Acidobacteria bacterium]|nr:hypothetical protein [Acidobacteriota bacterium]